MIARRFYGLRGENHCVHSKYRILLTHHYFLLPCTALSVKTHIYTTKSTNEATQVILMLCLMEGSLILNFLYKVPFKTRVKTSNGKVGSKYAKNARGL